MLKRFIYDFFKFFLNFFFKIFFYIPLIKIFLKRRFISKNKKKISNYPIKNKKNLFLDYLDYIFIKEHILKIKDQNEIRNLFSEIVKSEEGLKWAEMYYKTNKSKNLEDLKKEKTGVISTIDAIPLFKNLIRFIKVNNFENNNDVYIIQLGSSSGRDLEFFYNYFPKLNYISTDVSDKILDFQKEKYKFKNFNYFKCFAEDIEKCINHFQIESKNIIIFSNGSLQYVLPFFLKDFFQKIGKIKNVNIFINEPFDQNLYPLKDILSKYSGSLKFSHDYDKYAKDLKILDKRIIKLFTKNNLNYSDASSYYLHLSNK